MSANRSSGDIRSPLGPEVVSQYASAAVTIVSSFTNAVSSSPSRRSDPAYIAPRVMGDKSCQSTLAETIDVPGAVQRMKVIHGQIWDVADGNNSDPCTADSYFITSGQ